MLVSPASTAKSTATPSRSKTRGIHIGNLVGEPLNWAVAEAGGLFEDETVVLRGGRLFTYDERSNHMDEPWDPAANWAQAGDFIAENRIGVVPLYDCWEATIDLEEGDAMVETQTGATPLEAAMRCFVAYALGHSVEVPVALA